MVAVYTFKGFPPNPSLATNYPQAVTAQRITKTKGFPQEDWE